MRDLQSRSEINPSRDLRYIVKQYDIRYACDMFAAQTRSGTIRYTLRVRYVCLCKREKGRLYRIRFNGLCVIYNHAAI